MASCLLPSAVTADTIHSELELRYLLGLPGCAEERMNERQRAFSFFSQLVLDSYATCIIQQGSWMGSVVYYYYIIQFNKLQNFPSHLPKSPSTC